MKDRLEDKISIEDVLKLQEDINNDLIKLESVRFQMSNLQEHLEKRAEELGDLEKELINKEIRLKNKEKIRLKNKEKELLKKEVLLEDRFLGGKKEDPRKAYEEPSMEPEEGTPPGEEFLDKYRLEKKAKSDQKKAVEKSDSLVSFCTSRNLSHSYGQLPSVVYKPRIFVDGNMWCVLWGENLMEGVAGFGKSPSEAVKDFDKNWFKAI